MRLRPLYIFNSFSAGIDFRRQILPSKDGPAPRGLMMLSTNSFLGPCSISALFVSNRPGPFVTAAPLVNNYAASSNTAATSQTDFLVPPARLLL